jgi:hypothetical protein
VATAALGVPAAVVEVGLTRHELTPGQGAAIVAATLGVIAVSITGSALIPAPPPEEPPDPAAPAPG